MNAKAKASIAGAALIAASVTGAVASPQAALAKAARQHKQPTASLQVFGANFRSDLSTQVSVSGVRGNHFTDVFTIQNTTTSTSSQVTVKGTKNMTSFWTNSQLGLVPGDIYMISVSVSKGAKFEANSNAEQFTAQTSTLPQLAIEQKTPDAQHITITGTVSNNNDQLELYIYSYTNKGKPAFPYYYVSPLPQSVGSASFQSEYATLPPTATKGAYKGRYGATVEDLSATDDPTISQTFSVP